MSMPEDRAEHQLIAKSKSGDRIALQELLVLQFQALSEHVSPRIPASLRGEIDAGDIIQQTYVQVVRDINDCRAETRESFFAWVRAIADHRLQDAIRYSEAKKRGRHRQRAHSPASQREDSMVDLVELLSAGSHRPSRSAMRHEAIEAVHKAVDALPEEYRQAMRLRLIEGKSLDDTAVIMNRSPRAVQGLVDRAKKKMCAALGFLSVYE